MVAAGTAGLPWPVSSPAGLVWQPASAARISALEATGTVRKRRIRISPIITAGSRRQGPLEVAPRPRPSPALPSQHFRPALPAWRCPPGGSGLRPCSCKGDGMRSAYLLALALGYASCQPQCSPGRSSAVGTPPGVALAQGAGGGCHALEPHRASPNPQALAFPAIVNQAGLTDETLGSWLRDAHNYP